MIWGVKLVLGGVGVGLMGLILRRVNVEERSVRGEWGG
jgi:hypothetical protein